MFQNPLVIEALTENTERLLKVLRDGKRFLEPFTLCSIEKFQASRIIINNTSDFRSNTIITAHHKCICPDELFMGMYQTPSWLLYYKHLHSLDKHIFWMFYTFRTCSLSLLFTVYTLQNTFGFYSEYWNFFMTDGTSDLSQWCMEYCASASIIQTFLWEPQMIRIIQRSRQVRARLKGFHHFKPQHETHLHTLHRDGNIYADVLKGWVQKKHI